jgi:hypothetical protein
MLNVLMGGGISEYPVVEIDNNVRTAKDIRIRKAFGVVPLNDLQNSDRDPTILEIAIIEPPAWKNKNFDCHLFFCCNIKFTDGSTG